VYKAVAGIIRERRIASGRALNRLAHLTRLSRQMISFIETNQRSPHHARRLYGHETEHG
jgi:transcriptional regulator with XRE-family HTH domain